MLIHLLKLKGVEAPGGVKKLAAELLVAPAACARLLTHRLGSMAVVSSVFAIAGGIGGLYLSYYAGTAGGASIALCLVGAYLAVLAADAALRGRAIPLIR